jgi:transcription termination factor Rho
MSVLERSALEASPLADLHAIAGELSIDGYRRLRKAELIDRIIARQEGSDIPAGDGEEPEPAPRAAEASGGGRSSDASGGPEDGEASGGAGEGETSGPTGRRRRGRRGGRGRGTGREPGEATGGRDGAAGDAVGAGAVDADGVGEEDLAGRGQAAAAATGAVSARADSPQEDEPVVEGVVELLGNGSGFVRVAPPDPTDDDVYISAAQVKRCELVSGDRVSGPKRAPRRSERFASLVRVDTINGRPASEVADGARYEDLPAAFPEDRFRLGSEDSTLKAIEWLTPIGRGSRVTITGSARAGKSHALRRLAEALAADSDLHVFAVLAGVRPEEISEWASGPVVPSGAVSFAVSSDVQDHVVELAVEQARRVAARGGDAVLLIDTLDSLHPGAARKALAAARNILDGGSLTVIATSREPLGGETTVIALDVTLTSTGRFPALDLVASGTVRPERLVGEAGARAIADARAEALGG